MKHGQDGNCSDKCKSAYGAQSEEEWKWCAFYVTHVHIIFTNYLKGGWSLQTYVVHVAKASVYFLASQVDY